MSEHQKSVAGPEYTLGDRVRVRRGVTDPDFPDLTIGGWAGTVADADTRSSPPNYLIRWSRETLRAVHPIHRKRAERDGFEIDEMWLGADDLEPAGRSRPVGHGPRPERFRPGPVGGRDVRATVPGQAQGRGDRNRAGRL